MAGISKSEYEYNSTQADHTAGYLWQPVLDVVGRLGYTSGTRVLDVGCGNGAFSAKLSQNGFVPTGLDPSESGIVQAKLASPNISFHVASAYDDLASRFGVYPLVISLEVIEHLYSPRDFMIRTWESLQPGGHLIVSTPFHGYWKNLFLALTGKLDQHFTALWDHGHIKFWSTATLGTLLRESGYQDVEFAFAGRAYPFSKSMIAIARKPG